MDMLIVWAIVIAVSLVMEFLTMQMFAIWFAVGGLCAFVLQLCAVPLAWQIVVGCVIAILAIVFLRKFALKVLHKTDDPKTADILLGKTAVVVDDITKDAAGTVKVNGVVWTAISTQELKTGQKATITEIVGNKLKVKGD